MCVTERRLAALKRQKSKKDLVQSLSEKHRSCMEQLLLGAEVVPEDPSLLAEHRANALLRCMAPERQAISLSELVELLKADLLAQTVEGTADAE
ncbi:hypothetical protein PR048_031675 [Dryococelus australis]|uniref:Uncharacterized protein n=1 Tax=Dryococelus australis TaxID=614101 RepID=A0ABQ9G5Y9_9NEOP|nr:hypothetical protein PR048_031675 [Dryococelus australis]